MKKVLVLLILSVLAFSCCPDCNENDGDTMSENPNSSDNPSDDPDSQAPPEKEDVRNYDLIFGVFPDSEAEWVFLTDEEAVIGTDLDFNGIIDGAYIDSNEGNLFIEIAEANMLPKSVAFSSGEQAFYDYNEDFTSATLTIVNSDGTAEVFENVPVPSNSDSSANVSASKRVYDFSETEDTGGGNSVEYAKNAISTGASIAGCMLAPYANTVTIRNLSLLSCSIFALKWFVSMEEAKDQEGETPDASPNTLYTILDGLSSVLDDASCNAASGLSLSCVDQYLETPYGQDAVERFAKWADELANSDYNKPSLTILIEGKDPNLGEAEFDEVEVGAEQSKRVDITNNSDFTIVNLSSIISSSTDFIIDMTETSNSLNPNKSTSFFITFRPQSPGMNNSTITINTDAVGSIGLTVTGVGLQCGSEEIQNILNTLEGKIWCYTQPAGPACSTGPWTVSGNNRVVATGFTGTSWDYYYDFYMDEECNEILIRGTSGYNGSVIISRLLVINESTFSYELLSSPGTIITWVPQ